MPPFWTRLWKSSLSGSVTLSPIVVIRSDNNDEEDGLSATLVKEAKTMQNPLLNSDRRVSPDSHEKSEGCWLRWNIQLQRKRLKMLIQQISGNGRGRSGKEIIVTTMIEVVSSPALPDSPTHIDFTQSALFGSMSSTSDDGPASPRSVSRLMPSPPPSCAVDAGAGAERGHGRRHSIPFVSRQISLSRFTGLDTRPRSSAHIDGRASVLGKEAEWTNYLERANVGSLTSCGSCDEGNKGRDQRCLEDNRRSGWGAGRRCLERLGIRKKMRRAGEVHQEGYE